MQLRRRRRDGLRHRADEVDESAVRAVANDLHLHLHRHLDVGGVEQPAGVVKAAQRCRDARNEPPRALISVAEVRAEHPHHGDEKFAKLIEGLAESLEGRPEERKAFWRSLAARTDHLFLCLLPCCYTVFLILMYSAPSALTPSPD